MQLGLAVENQKVTLSVKYLAWEQLKYFAQDSGSMIFILLESYFALEENGMFCCNGATDELLTDSKKANLSFCVASPVTRTLQALLDLPDFSLSLRADDYTLPVWIQHGTTKNGKPKSTLSRNT
ncbi:hypothetical protein Sjap_016599 [Stephania japonica]|uniref:Uncharacterized protein n=1 Tax=Stephania japonica TaxID=461633 RepID=A0AAP0NRZ9_9MAGN